MADAGLLADADRHAGVGVAAVDAGNILLVQVDAVGGMGGHRHASQGQWRQGHELEGTLPGLDHFGSPDGLDTRPASCRPLSLSAFQREHRPPPRPVPPSCCCPDTRRAPDVPGPWGHRTRWGLPSILPQLLGARTSFTQEPKPDTGPVWRTAPYPPWRTTSSVVPDLIRRWRRPECSPARTGGLDNGSDPPRTETYTIRHLSGRQPGNPRGGFPTLGTTSSVGPDPIRRRRRPEGSPARTGGLDNGSDPARPDTYQIRQLSGRSSGNSRGGFTHL